MAATNILIEVKKTGGATRSAIFPNEKTLDQVAYNNIDNKKSIIKLFIMC